MGRNFKPAKFSFKRGIDMSEIRTETYKDGKLIETRFEPAPPPTTEELLQAQIDALLTLLAQAEQP